MTSQMDLRAYDLIILNTSGGKDSQTMLRVVHQMAVEQGVTDRLVAVHADLGRMEWAGTWDLVQEQAAAYDLRVIKVNRAKGDLIDQIEARGMFPSKAARYCTSDQKRDQVAKAITGLVRELGLSRQAKVLNCMGLRAQESPDRAARESLSRNNRVSSGRREVWDWLPIQAWTEDEVWSDIRRSGIRHHEAYDYGMPRLSCPFCVLAGKDALVRSAQLNPELASDLADLEERIGHTFQAKLSMRDVIREAACCEEPVRVQEWVA